MKQLIQYYSGNIKDSVPKGFVSIEKVLASIQMPKPENIELIHKIRTAETPEIKAHLKTKLYSFTPCALVKGARKYADITEFTGILALDFDKLPDENYADEFKRELFGEYKFIFAAWLSSSKKGVRALIQIPKAQSVDEFKHYYNAVEHEFSGYHGFDSAPKNCILPMFYSIDNQLLYRIDNTIWTTKKIPIVTKPPEYFHQKTKGKENWVYNNIKKAIDNIVDNGHPQLRGAAFALGGYVSAGYISEYDAVDLITNLINSNSYLSIKPSVYIRTAKEMIEKGQNEPLQFRTK
jgi:hypothetical protein